MSTTIDQPRSTPEPPSTRQRVRSALLGRNAAIIGLLLVVILVGSLTVDGFASTDTPYYMVLDVFPILVMALPLTLIIISGEIDLSIASTLAMSAATTGLLFRAGVPIELAAIAAVVVGAIGGALNGFLVTVVGLPSLAVTVGTLALYRGIAVAMLGTDTVSGYTESWRAFTTNRLGGPTAPFPMTILVFLVLAIVFVVVLHFTTVGRAIYAAGLNTEAAVFSGVDAARVKFWLFVTSGAVAALAGVYWALYYNSARGDSGLGWELSVVAAVLVGGVSIFGGRGGLIGVIAAVGVIGTIRSVLLLAGSTQDQINLLIGALLIASVILPRLLTGVRDRFARTSRRTARQRTTAAP